MIHIIKLGENKHRKLLVMKCYIIKIKTRKRSGGGKGKWGYSFTTVLLRFPKISSQNEGLVLSCKKRWEGSGNGTLAGVGRQPLLKEIWWALGPSSLSPGFLALKRWGACCDIVTLSSCSALPQAQGLPRQPITYQTPLKPWAKIKISSWKLFIWVFLHSDGKLTNAVFPLWLSSFLFNIFGTKV